MPADRRRFRPTAGPSTSTTRPRRRSFSKNVAARKPVYRHGLGCCSNASGATCAGRGSGTEGQRGLGWAPRRKRAETWGSGAVAGQQRNSGPGTCFCRRERLSQRGNQRVPVGHEGQVVRLGNGVVCHVACSDVEAGSECGVAVERGLDAQVGQGHGVAQGDVGQCVRGGVRNSAGHVGNAVEDRVVDLVRRVPGEWWGACPRSSRPGPLRCPPGPSPASCGTRGRW